MKSLLCALAILLFSSALFSQNKPNQPAAQPALKFPQFEGSKPRIEMPKALRLMRKFIKKQKINTSNYFLSRVNLIRYGAANAPQVVWYFRWVRTDGTVGGYIEIAVYMDGSAGRLPPM